MSLLLNELRDFAQHDEVIEVYRERLVPDALVGRVLRVSEHVVLLERLDEQYEYDGLTALRPGDVTRVRSGNRELRAGSRLCSEKRTRLGFSEVGLLEISAAMTVLAKAYSCVTLHMERLAPEMCFPGEPLEVDDDFVVFQQWGTLRTLDKTRLVLLLEEVTRVDADGKYQRMLMRAHDLEAGHVASEVRTRTN